MEEMKKGRITPRWIDSLKENEIFVFGSNLAGMHGGGAARIARLHFGAVMGKGVGLQGQSYAIPTMQGGVETIRPYVEEFLDFANRHPELHFLVTPIGCGIAGFEAEDIAPLFEKAKEMKNISISFKFNETTGRPDYYLNGELVEKEIRSLEVSNHVSPIAAVPFVREALVEQQQKMGEDKGIVMDGRDIGTTVFPNAELKIFVTASSQVRAQRRFDELKEKGMPADFDAILKNVEERDYIDTHRETSPLRKADDAITLDNSNMTIPEQKAWLMEQYQKAIAE